MSGDLVKIDLNLMQQSLSSMVQVDSPTIHEINANI